MGDAFRKMSSICTNADNLRAKGAEVSLYSFLKGSPGVTEKLLEALFMYNSQSLVAILRLKSYYSTQTNVILPLIQFSVF